MKIANFLAGGNTFGPSTTWIVYRGNLLSGELYRSREIWSSSRVLQPTYTPTLTRRVMTLRSVKKLTIIKKNHNHITSLASWYGDISLLVWPGQLYLKDYYQLVCGITLGQHLHSSPEFFSMYWATSSGYLADRLFQWHICQSKNHFSTISEHSLTALTV